MSKSPMDFKDATMLGGIIQILNIHYGSPFDEFLLLYLMLVSKTERPGPQGPHLGIIQRLIFITGAPFTGESC